MSASAIDTVFKVLSHSYRRYALDCLREHGTMALADLVDEVAARAFGTSPADLDEQERDRVFLTLYHTHIPLLAAADMVDFDQHEATVAPGEAIAQAEPFLSLANNETAKPA